MACRARNNKCEFCYATTVVRERSAVHKLLREQNYGLAD
jgi:hypothetical protein